MKRIPFIPRRTRIGLNMTSMIDVIFLLLIFFVCTANFKVPEEQLPMDLSQGGTTSQEVFLSPEERDLDSALVRVFLDGNRNVRWTVKERPCSSPGEVESVLFQLAAVDSRIPILLDPEDEVPAEQIIFLYDLCRRAGLMRFYIVANE